MKSEKCSLALSGSARAARMNQRDHGNRQQRPRQDSRAGSEGQRPLVALTGEADDVRLERLIPKIGAAGGAMAAGNR
jgi:hypothetical protein